jgi:Homeodomain-like domain
MPGPAAASVVVSHRQRQVLERIIRRGTSPHQEVRRARAVVAAAQGASNAAVGRPLGMTEDTVRLWRRRWVEATASLLAAECSEDAAALEQVIRGVLADAPRPGAPPTFTPEQLCQIMALACEPPAGSARPTSRGTARELAAEAVHRGIVPGISSRTVGRFLVLGGGGAQAAPKSVLAHAARRRS